MKQGESGVEASSFITPLAEYTKVLVVARSVLLEDSMSSEK